MTDTGKQTFSPGAIFEFDLVALAKRLYRRRMVVFLVVVLAVVAAVLYYVLAAREYEAAVTILPRNAPTSALGIVGQFAGLDLPDTEAPAAQELHYREIVVSNRILDPLVDRKWKLSGAPDSVSLYEVFGIELPTAGGDERRRAEAKLKQKLRKKVVKFSADRTDGFMTVSTQVKGDPALAAELANAIVAELDSYNLEVHKIRSSQIREFLESRVDESSAELRTAEDKLTGFVVQNQRYDGSAILLEEYRRLLREVQAEAAIWTQLRSQLAGARVEELKSMPSVQILDRASPPVRPVWPRPIAVLALSLVLGVFIGVILVAILEAIAYYWRSDSSLNGHRV